MTVTQRISTDGFTVSELVRLAAEFSLSVRPADVAAVLTETPAFSGRLLLHEVQPGLIAAAHDVTYLTDQEITSDAQPAFACGILLGGEDETMTVGQHRRITRGLERPAMFGFSTPTVFRQSWRAPERNSAAGFVLKPDFFDRFGDDVTDDGLTALREFINGEFRYETLARSPRLTELACRLLDHPYNGQLGQLFLESSTLAFVVEVAEQLKRERKMVALIGKRHYDRVLERRDILDADLTAPPKTLELARRVGVNLTTLQAYFKVVFGTTIFGYVRSQRLLMARVLLLDHDLTVAEAGYRVGFANPAAFTAAYRRYFGHPPGRDVPRDRTRSLSLDGI